MAARYGRHGRQSLTKQQQCNNESLLSGRVLVRGLFLLGIIAILLNVAFFATLEDRKRTRPKSTIGRLGVSKIFRQPTTDIDTTSTTTSLNASTLSMIDFSDPENHILRIFQEAGIQLTPENLKQLPTWDEIQDHVVGPNSPLLYNLEKSCAAYRAAIPGVDRNIGVSGMFNSGTNLVTQLLKENCLLPDRVAKYGMDGPFHDDQGKPIGPGEAHGIRWQVPWGKHMPANYRDEHATKWATHIWKESVLAVVTVRHPYAWMVSMCNNHYSAYWPHNSKHMCPHLKDPSSGTRGGGGASSSSSSLVPVEVKYDGRTEHYDSLAHLWNDWYARYIYNATFPYIVVRFEDVQFHAKNMTQQICECAGGVLRTDRPFRYIVSTAKQGPGHGSDRTGMLDAWIKYGKAMPPQNGFSKIDYDAAKQELNHDFMKLFGYQHPEPIMG